MYQTILKSWSDVAQRNKGGGNSMGLYLQRLLKPVRKNEIGCWNSLPEQVVNTPNVNTLWVLVLILMHFCICLLSCTLLQLFNNKNVG